ncbi:hypothetical protein JCM9279_000199 [Rhodotorula babjevae]
MIRPLPVELLDQILDDTSLDFADLARCCRVSRALFARARPQLYAGRVVKVDLDSSTCSSKTFGWWTSIQASPQAAALVRHLQLEDQVDDARHQLNAGDGTDLVLGILATSTNLEHLFLYPEGYTPYDVLSAFPTCANLRTL